MISGLILSVLICDVAGMGTPRQAQPTLDAFLRHIEQITKWPARSLEGSYHRDISQCKREFQRKKASIVVLDLATYLHHVKHWKLKPIGHLGSASSARYHLVVREKAYANLKSFKQKRGERTIVSAFAGDERFVRNIIFAGKLGRTPKRGRINITKTRRPLKALRAVARGQADGAIVDDRTLAYLGELQMPQKLIPIYTSPTMPGLTLATTRYGLKRPDLAEKLRDALPRLCKGPGIALCKTFAIDTFRPASQKLYGRLLSRYGSSRKRKTSAL